MAAPSPQGPLVLHPTPAEGESCYYPLSRAALQSTLELLSNLDWCSLPLACNNSCSSGPGVRVARALLEFKLDSWRQALRFVKPAADTSQDP